MTVPLIATGRDRTMIFSKAAMGPEQFGRLDLRCVEIHEDAPLSFMTADAVDLLDTLAAAAPVVPVTTRTPKQYRRIALPGRPFRYAVVSSGGRIITDGADDKSWRAHIDSQLSGAGADLGTVVAELESRIDQSWVKKFRIADELFCYIVVRTARQPASPRARRWPRCGADSSTTAPWPRRRPCSPPVTDCSTPTCSRPRTEGSGPRTANCTNWTSSATTCA